MRCWRRSRSWSASEPRQQQSHSRAQPFYVLTMLRIRGQQCRRIGQLKLAEFKSRRYRAANQGIGGRISTLGSEPAASGDHCLELRPRMRESIAQQDSVQAAIGMQYMHLQWGACIEMPHFI